MKIKYTLVHKDQKTNSRRGILHTNHGEYATPIFMPVGTRATVKTLSPEELKDIHSAVVLANTYHPDNKKTGNAEMMKHLNDLKAVWGI